MQHQCFCSGSGGTLTLHHSHCPIKAPVFADVPANWARPHEELEDATTAGSHVLIYAAATLIRSLPLVGCVEAPTSHLTGAKGGSLAPNTHPTAPEAQSQCQERQHVSAGQLGIVMSLIFEDEGQRQLIRSMADAADEKQTMDRVIIMHICSAFAV